MKILVPVVISVVVSVLTSGACILVLRGSFAAVTPESPRGLATQSSRDESSSSEQEFSAAPTSSVIFLEKPAVPENTDLIKNADITNFIDENHEKLFKDLVRLNEEKSVHDTDGTKVPLELIVKIHDAEELVSYYEERFGSTYTE